jgi:hypothetical protein
MPLPVVRGTIERRILINYRVAPEVLAELLPAPFEPMTVRGVGMAGVCLIRLGHLRPSFLPEFLGVSSENAAHRIAVQWEEDGMHHEGVYVPRRDTSSPLNAWMAGRVFPGVQHLARFQVEEDAARFHVELFGHHGGVALAVRAHLAARFPTSSVFADLEEASHFFEHGSLGYSESAEPDRFDGIELRSLEWKVEPLAVDHVASSFFDDSERFPSGSVAFDCALLMRNVAHEWHPRKALRPARRMSLASA